MHAGECKLGDLGMSKQVHTSNFANKQAHTRCGSPLYLAPEVHFGLDYNSSVDMWALGCTIFELVRTAYGMVRTGRLGCSIV